MFASIKKIERSEYTNYEMVSWPSLRGAVVAEYDPKQNQKQAEVSNEKILEEIKLLRKEVADVRAMLELSDIRKRDEYIRRGVAFPFTPEQSKYRPGTFRSRSIL